MKRIISLVVFVVLLIPVVVTASDADLLSKHEFSIPDFSDITLGVSRDYVLESELFLTPNTDKDNEISFLKNNGTNAFAITYMLDENKLAYEYSYLYMYRGDEKENMNLFREILHKSSEYLGDDYELVDDKSNNISRVDFENLEKSYEVRAIWSMEYFDVTIMMFQGGDINHISYWFTLTEKGKELGNEVTLVKQDAEELLSQSKETSIGLGVSIESFIAGYFYAAAKNDLPLPPVNIIGESTSTMIKINLDEDLEIMCAITSSDKELVYVSFMESIPNTETFISYLYSIVAAVNPGMSIIDSMTLANEISKAVLNKDENFIINNKGYMVSYTGIDGLMGFATIMVAPEWLIEETTR